MHLIEKIRVYNFARLTSFFRISPLEFVYSFSWSEEILPLFLSLLLIYIYTDSEPVECVFVHGLFYDEIKKVPEQKEFCTLIIPMEKKV